METVADNSIDKKDEIFETNKSEISENKWNTFNDFVISDEAGYAAQRLKFHKKTADFSTGSFQMPVIYRQKILESLSSIYGKKKAKTILPELERVIKVYYAYKSREMIQWEQINNLSERFSEKDVVLITYGDMIREKGKNPLRTLLDVSYTYFRGILNTIHILPFYPYSSDRGFSVIDYEAVNPDLGTWDDIANLKSHFKLMFDGVFNHVSVENRWFQEFLKQHPCYKDFFIHYDKESIPRQCLEQVYRPRTSDLLSEFETINGKKFVWTTFSADQVDLNYKNPDVLIQVLEKILTYVRMGADIIRLDAINYIWKELGTNCIHLPQSHNIVKLFRLILDVVAPHVAVITETNTNHVNNIKYFGKGNDEAQMIYNFALPPLVLFSFLSGDASKLSSWAAKLKNKSETATYFNFLDSHDGIGLNAARNILSQDEIDRMTNHVIEHGGLISYRDNGDGTKSPYELNVTWYSALNDEKDNIPTEIKIRKYMASRGIALVLKGVPGIYIHGLFGSKNNEDRDQNNECARNINREFFDKDTLIAQLDDHQSNTYKITSNMIHLIKKRIYEKAFHPNASQRVLKLSKSVFCVLRTSADQENKVLAIINVTDKDQKIEININKYNLVPGKWNDILSNIEVQTLDNKLNLTIEPYGMYWLKQEF